MTRTISSLWPGLIACLITFAIADYGAFETPSDVGLFYLAEFIIVNVVWEIT